jgi:hypothetical protein
MPVKNRHKIVTLGAVAAAAKSAVIDVAEVTRGIVYIETTTQAGTVELQVSPNGTDWYEYFDHIGGGNQMIWTTASANEAYMVDITARYMRLAVEGEDADALYFEGLREIS